MLLFWLACAASEPAGSLAVVAPRGSLLTPGPTLRGTCDASAGVFDGDRLWVADDERDVLLAFDRSGAPQGQLDLEAALGGDGKESDFEGVARSPKGTWWIGSHDRGKGTEPAPGRQQLVLVDLATGEVLHRRTDLLSVLGASPELGPVLAATRGHTSKDPGGFSIEGLAWADEALWVGLRAPVVDGKALLVTLSDPEGQAQVRQVRRLDLGGRGIRALETHGGALWIVAGPPDEGDFALYTLRGEQLEKVDVALGDLRPEGLVSDGATLWVLSDDGGVDVDGKACKKLPLDQRRARTATINAGG